MLKQLINTKFKKRLKQYLIFRSFLLEIKIFLDLSFEFFLLNLIKKQYSIFYIIRVNFIQIDYKLFEMSHFQKNGPINSMWHNF